MFSIELLEAELHKLTDKNKFLIAYSGGMDSHVLLHSIYLLAQQHPDWSIRAAHVHHGLSVNADKWLEHCQSNCQKLNIDFVSGYANVKEKLQPKISLEALARNLRYQILAELLLPDECLLTAQHADDQVETFLIQLFRGAGPKGLAAMPEIKSFSHSQLLRPLLTFGRDELRQFAIAEQLNWIEDESNENVSHDRNFIRHSLMPVIKQRWPGILTTVSRSAKNCAKSVVLLEDLAANDYANIKGSVLNTLAIAKLLQLDDCRQENILRYWLQLLHFPIPNSKKIAEIIKTVCKSRLDASSEVNWANVKVRRFKDNLYALESQKAVQMEEKSFAISWDLQDPMELPNGFGWVDYNMLAHTGINIDETLGPVMLCNRQFSAAYKVKNRVGTHQLRKLFQEWQIPPWLRDRTILVVQQNELIGHFVIF